MKIGFRVDAGATVGYGHLMRCLSLARELRGREHECLFCGNEPVQAIAVKEEFAESGMSQSADVWVVDLREFTGALANLLRQRGAFLVNLNGGDCNDDVARLAADLVFYLGPSRQPYELDWSGFSGEWFEGAEWVMLRDEFQQWRRHRPRCQPRKIVICGGGADIGGLTRKATDALTGFYDLAVILGASTKLARQGWAPKGIDVFVNPNIPAIFSLSDLAVVNYGTMAYEALCVGLPVVAFSYSRQHKEDADLDEARGCHALYSAGRIRNATQTAIRNAVAKQGRIMAMTDLSQRALNFVDGQGAKRVADRIENL